MGENIGMKPYQFQWQNATALDFSRWQADGTAAKLVAVLPVAAVEQHGPHLPLAVDADLCAGILSLALQQLPASTPVLVLPQQSIGKSEEHSAFAGTLSLSAATVLALWTEIGTCVAKAGVKKLLIFNTHGGQTSMLEAVSRQLRAQQGLAVFTCNWFDLPMPEALAAFGAHEHRFGTHGGEVETSMMLALHPERVAMNQAQNFASSSEIRAQQFPILGNGKSAKFAWMVQDQNPQGAMGNAAAATAVKGQPLVDAAALALAQLLEELVIFDTTTLRDISEFNR